MIYEDCSNIHVEQELKKNKTKEIDRFINHFLGIYISFVTTYKSSLSCSNHITSQYNRLIENKSSV